jgi:hypothetical protein
MAISSADPISYCGSFGLPGPCDSLTLVTNISGNVFTQASLSLSSRERKLDSELGIWAAIVSSAREDV